MKKAPLAPGMPEENTPAPAERIGQLVLYTSQDGTTHMQLRQESGGFWLSQKEMAQLYQISVPTVNEHLKTIFAEGEVQESAVIRQFLITASDGKNYKTKLYRLALEAQQDETVKHLTQTVQQAARSRRKGNA